MAPREGFRSVRSPALFFAIACGFLALPARAQNQAAAPKSATLQSEPQRTTPEQLLEPVNATPTAGVGDQVQGGPTTPVNPSVSGNGSPDASSKGVPWSAGPAKSEPPVETEEPAPEGAAAGAAKSDLGSAGQVPVSPNIAPVAAASSVLAGPPASPAPVGADLIKGALDTLVASAGKDAKEELRREYAAIAAYYAARDDAPLWLDNGKPSDAVGPAMAQLARAGEDGLDLSGLPTPVFAGAPDKLAAADVALSARVIAYGREASGSRVDPQTISDLIGAKPDLPDPALILAAVAAAATGSGAMLESFNPQESPYLALRRKLVELRAGSGSGGAIPAGRSLHIGMRDPRVPLLRARFGLAENGAQEFLYDRRVAAAVAAFQSEAGLAPSGVLTGRTVADLADPVRLEDEIIANMEFWRWMPRRLGADRVEVNIPDFMASVVEDGEVVARHKVIVGKPDTPTPVFSNTIKFLIVNPAWNVPPSIIRKEVLPHLAADPNYLTEMGYDAFMQNGRLVVRQPPGERNALGLIKFMFPNPYSVYLHDTPARNLFSAARRDFSHGCVRVDQPFALAQTLLGPRWPEARIKSLIGGPEHYVYLPKPLPIYIEYFTAFVDDAGDLQVRNDLYGYSRKVELALGLESEDLTASARDRALRKAKPDLIAD
jgi:L,D-transpeptidase YcbB